MKNIILIVGTALRLYFRQPIAIIMSLIVPVVVMIVFGFVFGGIVQSGDATKPLVVVVDEDSSDASKRFIKALINTDALEIETEHSIRTESGEEETVLWTRADAESAIRNARIGTAIVIPKGFESDIKSVTRFDDNVKPATIEFLADTSLPVQTAMTEGILQQATFFAIGPDIAGVGINQIGATLGIPSEYTDRMTDWMEDNRDYMYGGIGETSEGSESNGDKEETKKKSASLVDIKKVDILGEQLENPVLSQQVAGVLTMFMLFTVAACGASLLRERANGTLRRILISPLAPTSYLYGKYLAFVIISYMQVWVMLLAGFLVFKVEIWGHFVALAVFGLFCALAANGFGMLLAALCKTHEQVGAFSTLIILVMSALGGSMLPREFMPPMLKAVGNFTFNGWAMDGFNKIFWRDVSLPGLVTECAVMLSIALVLTLTSMVLFRRKMAF